MEAKKYFKILKGYAIYLLIIVLLGAFLGYFSTRFLPSGYRQSQVFFVSNSSPTPINPYREDKAITFTDSAVSILESPDFLTQAGVSGSQVDAKKLAHQVISLTVTSSSAAKSRQDLSTLVSSFNESTVNWLGDDSIQIKTVGVAQEPAYFALNKKVLTLFGVLIGLIVSITLISLFRYFKL